MKRFMDRDFLLDSKTARKLYHEYAEKMPILDYHCHLDPKEIYEDKRFENITQLWLASDHYKWRLMRSDGVEENCITGDAPDFEKFKKWAQTLETAPGNPLYHWSHMELQRYFGYKGILNEKTAETVWNLCNEKLRDPSMSARNLIALSGVRLLCTTDDPADSLKWHKKMKEDASLQTKVLPAFRPDKAMHLEKEEYAAYLKKLEQASGISIRHFEDLLAALKIRMTLFDSMGCRISDHGLTYVMYEPVSLEETDAIFTKRIRGERLTKEETDAFKTSFLLEMGREYHKRNWVMQIHFGVRRDNSSRLWRRLGADAGADCIYNADAVGGLGFLLNALEEKDSLPKTVLYSLNPADNALIGTLIGCFQDASCKGKIQQGSAWWFNDHKTGMEEQMKSLASLGLLGNFIGMLTDSRSFLSYTRHEYFRRILCALLGKWVENGEYPADDSALEKIIKGICYENACRYFGFFQEERVEYREK